METHFIPKQEHLQYYNPNEIIDIYHTYTLTPAETVYMKGSYSEYEIRQRKKDIVYAREFCLIEEWMNELIKFEEEYFKNWYSDEEGDSQPCNARSTNYCAGMSASFINNQVRKIVDPRSPVNPKVLFSFPSMTCDSSMSFKS